MDRSRPSRLLQRTRNRSPTLSLLRQPVLPARTGSLLLLLPRCGSHRGCRRPPFFRRARPGARLLFFPHLRRLLAEGPLSVRSLSIKVAERRDAASRAIRECVAKQRRFKRVVCLLPVWDEGRETLVKAEISLPH